MDFTWIILDNIIFGYSKTFKTIFNNIPVEKIILFDLDNTLIKTKSKKVFPINKHDWEFIIHTVPEIINKEVENNKTICGIISNQKGLKSQFMIKDWIDKLKAIGQQLAFHFIFVSLKDDRFRKPLPSSWDYIKTNLLDAINLNNIISKNKIYYIGDACGRPGDFSDTDIKYSINCGFKFKTPEMLFKFNQNIQDIKNCSATYPPIPYYTPNEQDKLITNTFNLIKLNINQKKKIFIMMIGFPASGKSFLRKEIIKKYPEFKYLNSDDTVKKIIDPNLINKNINKNITSYDYVIEDNTNLNKKTRTKLLSEFNYYTKIAIFFSHSMDTTKHLNYMRMYWFGAHLISQLVYRTLNKSFLEPDILEGFDNMIGIDKVFTNFIFENNKIKYYF
jgi:DNA 3'-phosphatase